MANKAYITPEVLKWARESAKISEEVAAAKAAVTVEKLRKWENGEELPTIKKAQTLAQAYRRPFALFFLPDIPSDFQPLQDFRKENSKELSTSSIFIIREIQQKQSWIREMYEEDGENLVHFVGKFSIKNNPEQVAHDIINELNINPLNYQTKNPILEWIAKAESKGIFISRTSFIHSKLKLDSNEMQGFAIADKYAPFVFINSDDWNAPQLFTLVHELAHIWIAETGISNEIEPIVKNSGNYNPIELFCNEVAANALMPKEWMLNIEKRTFTNTDEIFGNAKMLGVSSFAFLVRAFNLNIIPLNTYIKLRKEADIDYKKFLRREAEKKLKQKEKSGGPNYFLLQLNRNGRLFTQNVLDAFRGGLIEPATASILLNVKVNKFSKLENQMYR